MPSKTRTANRENPCNLYFLVRAWSTGPEDQDDSSEPVGIAVLAARLAPAKLSAGVERDALPVSGKLSSPQQQRDGRGSGRSSHHACCER